MTPSGLTREGKKKESCGCREEPFGSYNYFPQGYSKAARTHTPAKQRASKHKRENTGQTGY